ncbi:hypothetical protein EIN_085000 [Entamoeba invadens IP1]|uniref:hypothetical protein n=1 Tax=Entamoeba invadens IP1 TaxID=370355 RepID=UPI0002C3F0C8|nr:hypothetical protein EIN_085000 [Entamoeba invadens IP1]ELP85288.1 hypothetical protein EIN_085000 [Entamoeba invadens IP1]|eukprot:XP_004184634.1 hypothetical protein EIN_085000 [Entamoeba invadens IP1]
MINKTLADKFNQNITSIPDGRVRKCFELLRDMVFEALDVKNIMQFQGMGSPYLVVDFLDKHVLTEKVETELVNAYNITPELIDESKKLIKLVDDDKSNIDKIKKMSDEEFEFVIRHHRGEPIFDYVLLAFNNGELTAKKSNLVRRVLHIASAQKDIVLGCGYQLSRTQTYDLVDRMLKTSEKRLSSKINMVRKEKERIGAFITEPQIAQLENWTKMKVGTVVFDSNSDDWAKSSSVFGQRVLNRKNVVFVIKDTKNNVFGGYVNPTIERSCIIDDSDAFVFSLESNGRVADMKKFVIKNERKRDAFRLGSETWEWLFWMGFRDIFIWKKGSEYENFCEQQSFDYEGIPNALCGESNFLISRIIALQMI